MNLLTKIKKAFIILKEEDVMLTVSDCAEYLGCSDYIVRSRIESEVIKVAPSDNNGVYEIPKIQFIEQIIKDRKEPMSLIPIIKALAIYDAENTIMNISDCAIYLRRSRQTIINRKESGTIGKVLGKNGRYEIPKLQFMEKVIQDWRESA